MTEVSASAPAWSAQPPATHRAHPRRWIAVILALALVVVLTIAVVAVLQRRPGDSAGPAPSGTVAGSQPSTSADSTAAAQPVPIVSADDFDPTTQGGNGTENPSQVRYATDGDTDTRWTTLTYRGSPKLGRLKQGVGLVLDLGQPVDVTSVTVSLSGRGTDLQLRVPTGSGNAPVMTTDQAWRSVAQESKAVGTVSLTPSEPVRSQYLLVYLTSLPKEGNGYRGGIYEVEVTQ